MRHTDGFRHTDYWNGARSKWLCVECGLNLAGCLPLRVAESGHIGYVSQYRQSWAWK